MPIKIKYVTIESYLGEDEALEQLERQFEQHKIVSVQEISRYESKQLRDTMCYKYLVAYKLKNV